MRIVLAATGASGAIYLQRLLLALADGGHEIHLVLSTYAKQVTQTELGKLEKPEGVIEHNDKSMIAPFASGSAQFDAMVIVPCSMGTIGRIANGVSESLLTRAADVFLKEKRPLLVVARETPWNLIHARNVVRLLEAGASFIPAMPSFYTNPETIDQLVDTVVWRILDQLGIPSPNACRWQEETPE